MRSFLVTLLFAIFVLSGRTFAEPTTAPARPALDKPLYVEAYLRAPANPREAKISGNLTAYDDETLTIVSAGAERHLNWIDLTSSSAFVVRSRVIDKTSAKDWLELGRFGWGMGMKDQAKSALASAAHLDPLLKTDIASILASELGGAIKAIGEASKSPTTVPSDAGDTSAATNHQSADPAGLPPSQSGSRLSKDKVVKYLKSTPEQDAAAIENAKKVEAEVSQKMGIKFAEFQTVHFICFNDWGSGATDYLKENLEGAYTVVSQAFDIPPRENVFVGKLPVYMFAKQEDFMKFASVTDGFAASKSIAGYFGTSQHAGPHMAMWKPVTKSNNPTENHKAEITWAYVLTHEFTHAFISRYKSNQQIPRWLNEGLAEVIANSKFPRESALPFARMMATKGANRNYNALFDDSKMPGGEMYPVMMTMVNTLVSRDRAAFLKYFDDLKAGTDPDVALKKAFNLDDDGLIAAWKAFVTAH